MPVAHRLFIVMLGVSAVCAACTSSPDAYREGQIAYGRGDYAAAYKNWLPLAEQGHADAQGNLGFLYDTGRGVGQDYAEATKWYSKAAEQGNAEAQYNLGNSYREGQGVERDYAEAFKWFRKAVDEGFPEAYNNLGLMYEFGQGVPKDYIRAHASFSLASSGGVAEGSKNRDIVAKKMTPTEIAEAERLALDWMKKHGKAE